MIKVLGCMLEASEDIQHSDSFNSIIELELFKLSGYVVVFRKRFHIGDVARSADFLVFHERMTTCDELCDKQWMLYTISDRYAYFVRMPHPSIDYNVATAPFLSIAQFANAEALARIPHRTFIRESYKLQNFADSIYCFCSSSGRLRLVFKNSLRCTGQVVMLWTMARSGSTLVSRMLQCTDETNRCVLVFSEPDAFSMLAIMVGQYAVSVSYARSLLLAALRYSCKDQLLQQTIIFKMRSNCTKLVPHVHAVAPHILHAYIARKNLEETVTSQVAVSRRSDNIFATVNHLLWLRVLNLRMIHPNVSDWITTWGSLEWRLMCEIDPKCVLEVALAIVCQSFIDYVQYEQYFASPPVFYEDLMIDTPNSIKQLLTLCGISDVSVPKYTDCKRHDRLLALLKDSFDYGRSELKSNDREIVRDVAVMLSYPLIE
uniref:Sulfotransfer_1 domain-containing protein n=1 Tax=Syphacia muris TaxID=451379 RepID=A0A0N5AJU4_9BILA